MDLLHPTPVDIVTMLERANTIRNGLGTAEDRVWYFACTSAGLMMRQLAMAGDEEVLDDIERLNQFEIQMAGDATTTGICVFPEEYKVLVDKYLCLVIESQR